MKSGAWQKSSVANLYRYRPSAAYFVHLKVGGKLIRQSLNTKVLSVAQRRQTETRDPNAPERMTVGEAIAVYEQTLANNPALKPNAKLYRTKCLRALLKTWPI